MKNLLFFLLLFPFISHSMVIVPMVEGDYCSDFYLIGSINPNDSKKFVSTLSKLKSITTKQCLVKPVIVLHSRGGDVSEAIQIARFIRLNNLNTRVADSRPILSNSQLDFDINGKGECLSSCVLVLAGGVERDVYTEYSIVGIHRPYFSNIDEGLSVVEVRKERAKITEQIKSFLQEVDINPALAEDMLSTPPDAIKILSATELRGYRLSLPDANYEELRIAKLAKTFMMSSSEYRKRNSTAEKQCTGSRGIEWACYWASLLNISEREYLNRQSKSNELCTQRDAQSRLACRQKIMVLGN